jgi:hypothetical protein
MVAPSHTLAAPVQSGEVVHSTHVPFVVSQTGVATPPSVTPVQFAPTVHWTQRPAALQTLPPEQLPSARHCTQASLAEQYGVLTPH